MKFILKTSLLLAGTLLALDVAAARAADFQDMTVTVPFPFVVHNRTMPAGNTLASRRRGSLALLIRNENGAHVASYVPDQFGHGHDLSRTAMSDLHPERRRNTGCRTSGSLQTTASASSRRSRAGRRARMQLTSPTPDRTFASDRDRQARSSTWLSSCRLR